MYKPSNLKKRAQIFAKRRGYKKATDPQMFNELCNAYEAGYNTAMRDFNKLILPLE